MMNQRLSGGHYIAEHFTIADAALFYIEFWADRTAIPMPEHCRAHHQRLLQRHRSGKC